MTIGCKLCTKIDSDHFIGPVKVIGPETFDCMRCGRYELADALRTDYPDGFDLHVGIELSGLARETCDRRRNSESAAELLNFTEEKFRHISAAPPSSRTYAYYRDRFLQLAAESAQLPGNSSILAWGPLAARMYLSQTALHGLIQQLKDQQLLRTTESVFPTAESSIRVDLTAEGWARVDDLTRTSRRGNRAFVAMWFDSSMKGAYDDGVAPALVECGYIKPFRVDDHEHDGARNAAEYHQKIDDRILAEIRRARFLVVDVTGARPAVYYEAGFAEGLGIPIIWCCRTDWLDKMAFDTRQCEHIVWTEPHDLKEALVNKIRRYGWDRLMELETRRGDR